MLIMLSYQCCLIMDLLFSVMIKNVNESLNMERLWKISCEQPLWKYTRSAWCWQHHVTRNRWYPHFYSEKHVQYLGNCTCLPAQFAALRACFGSVSSFTSSQPVSCLVLFTENDSKRNMLSFSTTVWLFPLPGSARALLSSISAVCCGCTQVRLAKLQAAAESSAHKHRRDSLAKAGEGHQGAVCKQLS